MVISIANQKGGVGKTTTTLNLGVYLAQAGKKVLLIDLDPQSNLTSGLGFSDKVEDGNTIYKVLSSQVALKNIIVSSQYKNLSLAPAKLELSAAEVELVNAMSRETILKKALETVSKNYDYILIDCPPSLGLLTINALASSDQVLIPVQSEYYALEGLTQLVNTVNLVKRNLNPDLKLGGVVITMYDSRTNLAKDVADEIKKFFKDKVFETIIPRNVRLSEAPSHGKAISDYDPNSQGAKAYEMLAKEIVKSN